MRFLKSTGIILFYENKNDNCFTVIWQIYYLVTLVKNNEINNLLYEKRGEISKIPINNDITDSVVESGSTAGPSVVTGQVNHFPVSHSI